MASSTTRQLGSFGEFQLPYASYVLACEMDPKLPTPSQTYYINLISVCANKLCATCQDVY